MREFSVFYAYDDTEFFNREECVVYEEKALKYIREFISKVTFADENRDMISVIDDTIEECLYNIGSAYQDCDYMFIRESVTEDVKQFMYDQIGIILPDDLGLFEYDFDEGWIKVDD